MYNNVNYLTNYKKGKIIHGGFTRFLAGIPKQGSKL